MMKQSTKYKKDIQKQDRNEGGVFYKAKQEFAKILLNQKPHHKQKAQTDEYDEVNHMIINLDFSLIEENSIWKPLFTNEYLNHLDRYDSMNSLVYTFMIANGYFCHQFDEVEVQLIDANYPYRFLEQYFSFNIKSMGIMIIFRVGVHKNPIIEDYGFQGFEILHRITFIDIVSNKDHQRVRTICSKFYDGILDDPYYMDIPDIQIENQFMRNKNNFGFQDMFLFQKSRQKSSWPELQFNKNLDVQYKWMPNNINYLEDDVRYYYDFGQYIQPNWINQIEKRNRQKKIKLENINISKQFLNQESQTQIYEFLKRNSKFRAKLTHQEANVLKQEGNTVVIGRSGTGKTTCAILRLLIQQIVFKYQLDLNYFDSKIFRNRFDEHKKTRLHGLYVTENSILVKEVKRQYSQIIIDSKDFMNNSKSNQILCQYILKARQIREEDNQQAQKTPKSLSKYDDDDDNKNNNYKFPLFLDVFDLLLHLDSELDESYFRKFVDNHQANQQRLNNNEKQIYIDLRKGANQIVRLNINEIDYQIFKNIFWPTLKLARKYNKDQVISQVWTEIIQNIKGSKDSYLYEGYQIPYEIYIRKKQNRHYSEEQLKFIYETFEEYESWKNKMIHQVNYFDRLDYVNHLLRQIQNQKLSFNPIHFTMIDEVQDLPDAVIKLLYKLTEIEVYCSGDTAQNITKGIGFKFSKLNNILCELELFADKPKKEKLNIHHLTKNFRSNNQILQLANNIIRMIEALFPTTIDKLKSEEADRQGQKPSILSSNLNKDLKDITSESQVRPQENQVQYNGGFLRVILVRDEQGLKQAEDLEIPNSICLTVYSVKGLEYDEVILYNFFKSSTLGHEQIKLLKQLYWQNGIATLLQGSTDSYDYIDLCQELKLIYVAITRAKHSFIIFDEDSQNRDVWEYIWSQNQLVELVNNIKQFAQNRDKYINQANEQDQENYNQRWRDQGEMLYAQQNYKQAKKCFDIIKDENMSLQCEAYYQAQQAQNLQENSDNIQVDQQQIKMQFLSAANIFEILHLSRQAGQCYYQASYYEKALEIYLMNDYFTEAASCAVKLSQFQLAAILYHKENFYEQSIRYFNQIEDYYFIIITLIEKHQFLKDLDDKYLNYIPQFLNSLFDNYNDKIKTNDYSQFKDRITKLKIDQKKFQEQINIINQIKYPQTADDLYRCSKQVLGQAQGNISKKIISYMIGSQLDVIDIKNSNDIRQFCDILDYFQAYNLANCIRRHNNIKEVDNKEYYMTAVFNTYKMIKSTNRIQNIKNQQLYEQNKKLLLQYTAGHLTFSHSFGMIYMFLGQQLFNQVMKQEMFIHLYKIQNQQIPQNINQLLKDSVQYNMNQNQFKDVIRFLLCQMQNNQQQIENVSPETFVSIILFLSLINHLFSFNVAVKQQLTLCQALQEIFQFQILTDQEFQIISPQYCLINQDSQLFQIILQKYDNKIHLKKEENIFMIQSKFILKALQDYFNDFTVKYYNQYIQTHKYQSNIHIPLQIYLYILSFGQKVQQLNLPQNIDYDHKEFEEINILKKDDFFKGGNYVYQDKFGGALLQKWRYNLFFEKQLRQQFKYQLQQPYFYFQTNHKEVIKIVVIKKALHLTYKAFNPYKVNKSMEKLLQAIQISCLTKNRKKTQKIFQNIQLLNYTYNEPLRDGLIQYIYNYKEAQLCLSSSYIDFSYLYFYLNQQEGAQPTTKFNQRRDFLLSFILILIWIKLLIKYDEQQQIYETEIQIKINQEFITCFEYMDYKYLQLQDIGIVKIRAVLQYNKDEMWQIIKDWFKHYIHNINELGKLYLMILAKNIYQNNKWYDKIDNLIKELNLYDWQVQKLQQLFDQEQQNLQNITFIITKVGETNKINEFQPIPHKNQLKPLLSGLSTAYNHILQKNRIPQDLFLQSTRFDKGDKYENAIYRPLFQSCHNNLALIREKLIIYMFNHSDNNISFKSCFQQLLVVYQFYDHLFDENYYAKEVEKQQLNNLYKQIAEVSKVISEWESKQVQYLIANKKIDKNHKEEKVKQKEKKKIYHINLELQQRNKK